MAIIEVKGLGKKYKGNAFYSLENATFTIEEGDIIGLVGKNGSGKSTLLKILAKSQNPTEGNVFFNGRDIFKEDNILKDFGIMIEPVFFPQISVEENLKLYLKIHKKEQYQDNIEKILKLVGLWEAKDRKPIDFSFGMKQRTALALALVTEPQFVLLDEPFVGLDPAGVRVLLDYIVKLRREKGVTILISSHQLHEIEEICDYFLFINGKSIETHTKLGKNKIIITLEYAVPELEQSLSKLVTLKEGQIILPHDMMLLNSILKLIYKYNCEIKEITVSDSIEELFRG